jgi:hypothetical protein
MQEVERRRMPKPRRKSSRKDPVDASSRNRFYPSQYDASHTTISNKVISGLDPRLRGDDCRGIFTDPMSSNFSVISVVAVFSLRAFASLRETLFAPA